MRVLMQRYPFPPPDNNNRSQSENKDDNVRENIVQNNNENAENIDQNNNENNNENEENSESEESDNDADLLNNIDTLEAYISGQGYEYSETQLQLLDRLREAIILLDESTEICACGFFRINGYYANKCCALCFIKYFIHILLSCEMVLNNHNQLREADKFYEEYQTENDRVFDVSVILESIMIKYLEKTVKLIGSCPISWLILQGKPSEPRWTTHKQLTYLNFFRSKIVTSFMVRNYGANHKWKQLSNCIQELVAESEISMHPSTIYMPLLNRHTHEQDDGSFNTFFRFKQEIVEEHSKQQREITGEQEPTFQQLQTQFELTHIHYHLLHVLWNNNRVLYDWHIKRLAYRRQHPEIKPMTGLGFVGKKGSGKDTGFDFVHRVFDLRNSVKFTDLAKICGRFNADVTDRMFVCCNEVNRGDIENYLSMIKGFITNNTMHKELKFKQRHQVPMTQEFWFLSNYIEALVPLLTNDSRRLCVNEISDHKVNDMDYFVSVHGDINNKDIQQLFWCMLGKMDVSEFDWRTIPETDIMRRMKSMNLENNVYNWLVFLCNTDYDAAKKHSSPHKYMNPNNQYCYFLLTDAFKEYGNYIKEYKLGKFKISILFKYIIQNTLGFERKKK
eukprot:138766_1